MSYKESPQEVKIFHRGRRLECEILHIEDSGVHILTKEAVGGTLTVALPYCYIQAYANWFQQLAADGTCLIVLRYRAGTRVAA